MTWSSERLTCLLCCAVMTKTDDGSPTPEDILNLKNENTRCWRQLFARLRVNEGFLDMTLVLRDSIRL